MRFSSNHPTLVGYRLALRNFIENKNVVRFIILLIVINSISLGIESDPTLLEDYDKLLSLVDKAILSIFTAEIIIKIVAYRSSFFFSGWNIFDFFIVGMAWIPSTGPLAVLRALRILRVFRLFSVVPQMRRVLNALMHSIPGMFSVIGILILIFYVSAVLATTLFGSHPDPRMQEWFGSLPASLYTLFQIMTLESWSMGIVRPTMEIFPLSWSFFVPFIIITSFAVLNLFIGIIVDAMQSAQLEPREDDKLEIKAYTHREMEVLHGQLEKVQMEIETIKNLIKKNKG